MKMEFTALKDFLLTDLYLQNGDYVYNHDNNDYPLKKELDASKLYVVISADGHKLKAISFSGKEGEIDLTTTTGFWWVLKLPEVVRKNIGL